MIPTKDEQNTTTRDAQFAPSPSTVGARLQRLRTQQDLSVRELAKKAGVDKGTVVRIEQGKPYQYETLIKICQALSIHISRLTQSDLEVETVSLHSLEQCQWLKHSEINTGMRGAADPTMNLPEERKRLAESGEGVFFHLLNCTLENGSMFGSILELWGRSQTRMHPGQEFLYCIKGEAELVVSGRSYLLKAGEAATFWSSEPHSYAPSPASIEKNDLPATVLTVRNDGTVRKEMQKNR